MDRFKKFILGSKQQQACNSTASENVKNREMSIEEAIRRYEQQCTK